MSSAIMGIVLMVLCVAGLLRSLILLREAKRDHEALRDINKAIDEQMAFYIRANRVHLSKYTVAFIAGLGILASGSFDLLWLRIIITPLFLIAIIFLTVTLGEIEAHTKGRIREYYREGG